MLAIDTSPARSDPGLLNNSGDLISGKGRRIAASGLVPPALHRGQRGQLERIEIGFMPKPTTSRLPGIGFER